MGTRTIHTLAYKLLVDGQDFQKGTVASRSELAYLKREMRSTLTPAQKMEVSLAKLGKLAKKDAQFQALYNMKLAQYRQHLAKVRRQTSLLFKASGLLKSKLLGITTALAGAFTVGAIIQGVNRQIDRVDKLSKKADQLGISIEQLTRFQFAFNKIAGLTGEQSLKAFEKMTRRVSEAAVGTGEAKSSLEELGLEAAELAAMSPDKAFLKIKEAASATSDEHVRLRLATKLFDDEQSALAIVLGTTNEELERQLSIADQLGAKVDDVQAAKLVAAKDAMTDLNTVFQAFSTEFAVQFAPSLTKVTQELTSFLTVLGPRLEQISILGEAASSLQPGKTGFFTRLGTELVTGRKGREIATRRATQDAILKQQQDIRREETRKQDAALRRFNQQESDRKKDVAEALRLTRSVRTEEEKHADTLAKINDLRKKGLITQQVADRIISRSERSLKDSLISKLQSVQPQTESIGQSSQSGPLDSIAARSSAAFAILNRTSVNRQVEVELAKKQVSLAEQSLAELQKMANNQQTMPEGGVDG